MARATTRTRAGGGSRARSGSRSGDPSGNQNLIVVLLLVAALIWVVKSTQDDGPWESWSRDGFWKLDRGLADPAALYADGLFHVYTTSSTECVPGNCPNYAVAYFTGEKLNEPGNLRGDAMPEMPAWVDPEDRAIWAPSVARIGATYNLYFSASAVGTSSKCIGVAVSAAPGGPFAPWPEPIYCTSHYWSLDPYAVGDGTNWFLLWRHDTPDHPAGTIVSAPLTPDGMALAGGEVTLLVGEFPWEDTTTEEPGIGPVENPALARHPDTGEWLLTWSGNNWQTASYATGLALCQGPLGPCTRLSLDVPWLRTSEDPSVDTTASFVGAGGLSFVTDEAGKLFAIFHAYRGTGEPAASARVGWAFAVKHGDSGYQLDEFR